MALKQVSWPRTVVLVVIENDGKLCRRFVGRSCTHVFEVERQLASAEVELMRMRPTRVGEPAEPVKA